MKLKSIKSYRGCYDHAGPGKPDQHQQHQKQQQQPMDHSNAVDIPIDGQTAAAADEAAEEIIQEAAEDTAAQNMGMQDHTNSDLVPYAQPAGDMGMLASGALENQMSAEISALMKAALHSGRQIDVELPSGAVMRIR